ncbi:hypothetical protein K458DRAFT_430371 [Lentithecium fluviatile CBS 122367]|uniref:Peptidase M10 metallopeptidase domain-containing protein n=1 Tax=Lentithecium fluviatile CBS 122367 TaxID=1168545 RepID=A0A6G1J5Y5_9PLEO|nr:hypothetical protein K458DRAFT_430371 [Lentithecium fluviatile CBS 122367]
MGVALHELGHSLGLDHSEDSSAVMWPWFNKAKTALRQDGISGIQSLYGVGSAPWKPMTSYAIKIAGSGGQLFQLQADGCVYRKVDTAPFWELTKEDSRTKNILSFAGNLFTLRTNGDIMRWSGVPLHMVLIDSNPTNVGITGADTDLCLRHTTGAIWRHRWTPGDWEQIDTRTNSVQIAAGGEHLYQLLSNSDILEYTKPGWKKIDFDDSSQGTAEIVAPDNQLYKRRHMGDIWVWVNKPNDWECIESNQDIMSIVAGGEKYLFQVRNNGAILRWLSATGRFWRKLETAPNCMQVVIMEDGTLYYLGRGGYIFRMAKKVM